MTTNTFSKDAVRRLCARAAERVGLTVTRECPGAALETERRFLQAVLDSVEDGIVACDSRGRLTLFNRATSDLHGLPARALPADRWAEHYDLYHPDGRTPMSRDDVPLFRVLQGEVVDGMEMVIAPRKGASRRLRVSGRQILASDGSVLGAVVAMHDVTERRRAEDELAHLALHDPVTSLPNRILLVDRIEHALLAKDPTSDVCVLCLDVDNFKAINDAFGRDVGDQLLVEVASRLTSGLQAADTAPRLSTGTVARMEADKFMVLCEGLDAEEDGLRIAEQLKRALARPVTLPGTEISVTVSIGIAFPGDTGAGADALIRDADVAMYRAKEEGRNRCELFDETMRMRVVERLRVERELRGAVERDELRLHYQPIVSVADGSVVGLEALVRWEHPRRGLVFPCDFIPIAEESGLIVPIGIWVLQEACRQIACWEQVRPAWPSAQLFVNVSPRQLTPDFLGVVSDALTSSGLDPARLVLEITEGVIVEKPEAADLVRALRQRGVRLALDDFGTGYSSLAYLIEFPLDVLKIDRSLVAKLDHSVQTVTVTTAALGMGQALGMLVIGEGVETPGQLTRLRELGCPLAQGYLFSAPRPADAAAQLFEAHPAP